MKTRTKITIGFGGEIVFFVLTGAHIANGRFYYAIIALICAMMIAGFVGKWIEKDAIEKYKGGELR